MKKENQNEAKCANTYYWSQEYRDGLLDNSETEEDHPKYYDEPEEMTWYEAMKKYKNHPVYRLMTSEELKKHYEDETLEDLTDFYWSSSESTNNLAWVARFCDGCSFTNHLKDYPYRVRVVDKETLDCKVSEDEVWYNEESKKAILDDGPGVYYKDETEYLMSSEPNADHLKASNKAFEEAIEDHLDKERSDTKITPQALVDLGFKEVYQGIDQGDAGYLYYDLEIKGVGLLSTSLGEDQPLHIMLGYEGQHPIHNLAKLKELIRILTLID